MLWYLSRGFSAPIQSDAINKNISIWIIDC